VASGIGALVFTGFGNWTGLEIGALSLPSAPTTSAPDTGDFLWGTGRLCSSRSSSSARTPWGGAPWPGPRVGQRRTVLATLLLGRDARDAVPLMITASVLALVTTELLRGWIASSSASSTSSARASAA
jgi:hypothetical protein